MFVSSGFSGGKKSSSTPSKKAFSIESAIEGFFPSLSPHVVGAKNLTKALIVFVEGNFSPICHDTLGKKSEKHERRRRQKTFFRAPRPPSLYAEGKCLQSFEIHYGGVSTSLCQPHIFLPFSIITFLSFSLTSAYVFAETVRLVRRAHFSTTRRDSRKTPFNNFSLTF